MTLPILEKDREELVTRMKVAHEEDDQPKFDELKEKIESIDKKISNQQFIDQQSVRAIPQEKADEALSTRVAKEYDLGKALRHAAHDRWDGLEGEVQTELRSNPANKRHPMNAVLIPDELSTRAVTAGTAGAMTLTESYRPQEFLTVLRDRSIAGALGARMIAGMGDKIRIPRQGAATTASWQTETGAVTATDMTFLAPIELEAHRLSYHTSHSDQIIRESGGGLPIQRIIIEEGQRALADKLDASIFSTNSTQETNAPTQLWKVGSVGSITARARSGDTNGLAITQTFYNELLELAGSASDANLPMMRPSFAINYKTMRKLKQLRKLSGSTDSMTIYQDGMIDGYPTQVSNRVTDSHSKGTGTVSVLFYSSDWQYLVIATWGNTALIIDPYSSAPSSTVRLVWHQFVDYKILRDGAFGWFDSILLS